MRNHEAIIIDGKLRIVVLTFNYARVAIGPLQLITLYYRNALKYSREGRAAAPVKETARITASYYEIKYY